ncbi:hypothetical protein DB30_05448 [Enhygromyxa salina]|uniref:Uncharacterized protein n=1 Tax=Enhygromyxa salina TaxID=215803 RepID=A0A0C1ZD01_9BACT|nr:SGNH/GDSL hydrolase family protein [Enhygromyxa salina]KIG15574.1 hypothetical protein DB30_05448 [Enhygromyxa salina]
MAPLTLVALGDSLTQGFLHGAMQRPNWSFPAILARGLGLEVPTQHRVPEFLGAGHPLNLEDLLRHLQREIGDTVETRELLLRLPKLVPAYVDEIEDFYERGPGSKPSGSDTYFHNLGAWGFRVGDALRLTSRACAAFVRQEEGLIHDDLLALPCAPMYRSAQQVLNPAGLPARANATILDNLRALAAEEPIDLLTLWLGANDCLATVLEMKVADMPSSFRGTDQTARREFNLTSAAQFHSDYAQLVDEVAQILSSNPGRGQVYVGTVPHVTILPLTNGLGTQRGKYYDHYGRFFRNEGNRSGAFAQLLTRDQVIHIDERIDAFNGSIRSLATAQGWTVVDIAQTFDELAVKRNDYHDDPGKPLRDYLGKRGFCVHPLLELERPPSILPYTVEKQPDGARRKSGGLVGLDHAHPSTLGYGLMAERFLQEIQASNPDHASLQAACIDWADVLRHDTLEQDPPALWADLMTHADRYAWLWEGLSAAIARHVG